MAHTAELTHRQIYSHRFVFQRTSAVCVREELNTEFIQDKSRSMYDFDWNISW